MVFIDVFHSRVTPADYAADIDSHISCFSSPLAMSLLMFSLLIADDIVF